MHLILGISSIATSAILLTILTVLYAIVKHTSTAILKLLVDNNINLSGKPARLETRMFILIILCFLTILAMIGVHY